LVSYNALQTEKALDFDKLYYKQINTQPKKYDTLREISSVTQEICQLYSYHTHTPKFMENNNNEKKKAGVLDWYIILIKLIKKLLVQKKVDKKLFKLKQILPPRDY